MVGDVCVRMLDQPDGLPLGVERMMRVLLSVYNIKCLIKRMMVCLCWDE